MKKIGIIVLIVLMVVLVQIRIYGYQHFEHIEIVGNGKMLNDFTDDEYKEFRKKVGKRKFMGWQVHEENKDMKVKYVSETLFSYYNNGTSTIEYKYQSERKTVTKIALSVSGSLSVKTSKTNKIFGDGLNASIKTDSNYQKQDEFSEKINLNIKIEPKTQLNLYLYGEGYIHNGFARKYVFWIKNIEGGYEEFHVTTHYQRLEVTPI